MPQRICAVLGLGLLMHMNMQYPAISRWFDSKWKGERVASVSDYLEANVQEDGTHNADPAFWQGLAVRVMELCEEVCVRRGCASLVPPARDRGDLVLEVTDPLLRMVCDYLHLDLLVLRQSAQGLVQETTRNNCRVGLELIVAVENEAVMVLYHEKFYQQPEGDYSGFPFFLEPHQSVPRLQGFSVARVNCDAAIEKATEVLEAVVDVLAAKLAVPRCEFSSRIAPLQQCYSQHCTTLHAFSTPPPAALKQISQLAQPHDITKCVEYPMNGDYFTIAECGHRLHTDCLLSYLNEIVDSVVLGQEQAIVCPLCPKSLSDATLQRLSPAFYSSFIAKLAAVQETANFAGNLVKCANCPRRVSIEQCLYHEGHSLCMQCLGRVDVCPVCRKPISSGDREWAMQSEHFVRKSHDR